MGKTLNKKMSSEKCTQNDLSLLISSGRMKALESDHKSKLPHSSTATGSFKPQHHHLEDWIFLPEFLWTETDFFARRVTERKSKKVGVKGILFKCFQMLIFLLGAKKSRKSFDDIHQSFLGKGDEEPLFSTYNTNKENIS